MQIVDQSITKRQVISSNQQPKQLEENIQQQQQQKQKIQQKKKSKLPFCCYIFLIIVGINIGIVVGFSLYLYFKLYGSNNEKNPNLLSNYFEANDPLVLKVQIMKGKTVLHSWDVDDLFYNYDEKNYVNKTFIFTKSQIFTRPYPTVAISIQNKRNNIILKNNNDLGKLIINQEKFDLQLVDKQIAEDPYFTQPKNRVDKNKLKIDTKKNHYYPILDTSQFWVKPSENIYEGQLEEQMELHKSKKNDDLNDKRLDYILEYNTTVIFNPEQIFNFYLIYYIEHMLQFIYEHNPNLQSHAIQIQYSTLEYIENFSEYSLILAIDIAIFMVNIFKILGSYYGYKYWKNLKNYYAISLKSVYYEFVFFTAGACVVLPTLVQNFEVLEVSSILCWWCELLWKVLKISSIKRKDQFPYYEIYQEDQVYIKTTENIEKPAIGYLNKGIVSVIIVIFLISFVLEPLSESDFIIQGYVFASCFSTLIKIPQLYLNYKFKSVEHFPWTVIIFRFLESILFLLEMQYVGVPIYFKIIMFGNSFAFFVYVYQRICYKDQDEFTDIDFQIEDNNLKQHINDNDNKNTISDDIKQKSD